LRDVEMVADVRHSPSIQFSAMSDIGLLTFPGNLISHRPPTVNASRSRATAPVGMLQTE
jgi:hypothetical protein